MGEKPNIVVRPEMIEAGLVVMRNYVCDPDSMDLDITVECILRAALSARPLSLGEMKRTLVSHTICWPPKFCLCEQCVAPSEWLSRTATAAQSVSDELEARDRAAQIEIPAYLKKGYTGLVNEFGDDLCPNCRSDNFAVVDGHCDEVGCKS